MDRPKEPLSVSLSAFDPEVFTQALHQLGYKAYNDPRRLIEEFIPAGRVTVHANGRYRVLSLEDDGSLSLSGPLNFDLMEPPVVLCKVDS